MTSLERVELPADKLSAEAVVALYFADKKPLEGPAALLDWRLNGQLTRMLLDGTVKGKAGEHVMLQSNGKIKADWILFVGGGKWDGLCEETHAALIRHLLGVVGEAGFKDISLAFMPHEEASAEVILQQITEALKGEGRSLSSCRFSCESSFAV